MHDFRVVDGERQINLIFDVVVPFGYPMSDQQVQDHIQSEVKKRISDHYFTVIDVDKDYL